MLAAPASSVAEFLGLTRSSDLHCGASVFDDIDQSPIDFDDLDLPDPEDDDFDEDVSEDPTVVAATDELLAAVAAKVNAINSVGQIELGAEDAEDDAAGGAEPTLAHQAVPPPVVPTAPTASAAPAASAAPQAVPEGSGIGGLILVTLLFIGLIAGAMLLAMNVL